jgi:hypothetical protein
MMIKKYILVSTLVVTGLLSFNSCDKNLDIDISKEQEANFFSSEYRITQGVGAAYAQLTNIYGGDLANQSKHGFWLLPGDDITAEGTGNPLETFAGLNGSNNSVRTMWITFYKIISRCNFMLAKIEEPEIIAKYRTEGLRDANRAELLFLRSWANFRLWDNWRKAPLQNTRITTFEEARDLPSSEGFELLDNAISSLEEAAPLARESWDSNNSGRITRDACYGLLVKLYVTKACYNSKSEGDYGKAIVAFDKISDKRKTQFKMVPYGSNFDYRTENNAESLFEFQASLQEQQDNPWLDNDFGGSVGMMSAFYHYGDAHWANYSSGTFGPTQKLINAFHLDDPRKKETLSNSPENFGGSYWWINPSWGKFNNYQLVKYTNGERGKVLETTWFIGSNNNVRILRLADVKLLVAEAYLATGQTAKALEQVNDVRERARNSASPASAHPAALGAVTMTEIMNERFIELAAEDGHRWSDLKRWHTAGYINLATWTAADFGFPYEAGQFQFDVNKHLLFPIPTDELNRNPLMAASGQNPGY